MADVSIAIDFVLRQEDASLSGAVTQIRGDAGGATRFGIASKDHAILVAQGYFDAAKVTRTNALAIAEQVYASSYAAPLHIERIDNQQLANAVLSFGINAGLVPAARALQLAVNACGAELLADGVIGPLTVAAVNACEPAKLLSAFQGEALDRYRAIGAADPEDEAFMKGWENRVAAWSQQAMAA